MASINKVIILGNLGANPDVRATTDGISIATINVATSRRTKDRNTGEFMTETDWHRIVAFRQQADFIKQYFVKGSAILVEGRLRTRKWQDQEGRDRYVTEIIAENVQFGGSKASDDARAATPSATPISGGEPMGMPPAANFNTPARDTFSSAPRPMTANPMGLGAAAAGGAGVGLAAQTASAAPTPATSAISSGFDDLDSDIPF